MGSASFEFLGFALLVIIVFNLNRSVAWRQAILLIASVSFLAFFANRPAAYIPMAAFLAAGLVSLRLIQSGRARTSYTTILCAFIAAFFWLKRYAFVPSPLVLPFPYLTLGLSYIFFRVLHLIIEAHEGNCKEKIGLVSYLNYTLDFTTLVSGPIQRYEDFASQQLAPKPLPLDIFIAGQAFERIVIGFFKVNVLSLLFSMTQNQELAALSAHEDFAGRLIKGIVIAVSYTLYLYCNFSGYIDIVIGIARFLRLQLPENFNRPFASENFINFWSRWHITLSDWLKRYVYNPLLLVLMRRTSPAKAPYAGVFAFFVTFFLVGLWHGPTANFLFFGVLQGTGVSVNKLYQIVMTRALGRPGYRALSENAIYNLFARGFTFTWFTFTLLWFWSNWGQLASLSNALRLPAIVAVWICIFVGASVVLAAWEALRNWLLSIEWQNEPFILSRYVRTVWDTALVVIAVAAVLLVNAPAPDIVYKAF